MNAIVQQPWLLIGKRGVPGATLDLSFMTPGSLDSRITFTRASTGTYFDVSGTLQTAATNAPRWDYDPLTLVLRGLLIEEARTNIVKNSTMVGAAAGSPGTDPTGWAATAIGGLTRTVVGVGTVNGIAYIDYRFSAASATGGNLNFIMSPGTTNALPASPSTVYTMSTYLAFVAGSFSNIPAFTLRLNQLTSAGSGLTTLISGTFNTNTFTIGSSLINNRLTFPTSATDPAIAFLQPFIQIPVTAGAVDFTLRIGAPQVELGAFATSYIPTTAAAATRATESATMPTSPWYTNPLAASFVAEALITTGSDGAYLEFDDGTPNSRMVVSSTAGTHAANAFEISASTTIFTSSAIGAVPIGTPFKLGYSSTASNRQYTLNGLTPVGSTASALNPPTVTTLRLGKNVNPTSGSFYLRRVRYWPRVLSDAELQSVTR